MTDTITEYDFYNYPSTATLDSFDGPYLIADPSKDNAASLFSVEIEEFTHDGFMVRPENRVMFYIVGGELTERSGMAPEVHLQLRHSWATDFEHDRSYLADLVFQNFQVEHYYGHSIQFSGWLTEARFYPHNLVLEGYPDGFNPFEGEVESDETEENSGYPYQPAAIKWETDGYNLPRRVTVKYYPNLPGALQQAQEFIQQTHNRRATYAAEREKAKQEKAERDRVSREEQKKWLQTEEGHAYLVLEKFNTMMKVLYPVALMGNPDQPTPIVSESTLVQVVEVFTRAGDGEILKSEIKNQMRHIRYPEWKAFCEAVIEKLS